MIRLTLRQFRTQGAVALAALVAVGVAVLATRPHLVHLYQASVATCGTRGDCTTVIPLFLHTDRDLRGWLSILVVVVPGLIGAFWGAPLVARELEGGTFRLAWSQSVTRTRWMVVKLAVVGGASMLTAGLLSLEVSWWASPLDRVGQDRFGLFDQRSIVPIGYALFAFALGVALGAVIRRVLPAMAATVVGFVFLRLLFGQQARPRLLAATRLPHTLANGPLGFGSTNGGPMRLFPQPPPLPDAWMISSRIVDAAGHRLPSRVVASTCPDLGQPPAGPPARSGPVRQRVPAAAADAMHTCVTKLSARYHEVFTYQPASHYWPIQWIELGCFVAGALVLAAFTTWWVRRRLG